jgi:osmoprotectant transport system permease protein
MTGDLEARLADALARLPDYLGGHVRVSMAALALGIALSIPLALVSVRRPALRAIVLALSSIAQTIPGLALLALFYPLLLGLAALSARAFGVSFSAFGFLPAVLALALYSLLPVLRNAVTGLTGIDPAINEAALGVGMTRRQALWMVEMPLALPVVMAGIRTAAVWVIGTATLSTPIGQTSLGNYIFAGLQTQNWVFVLFGCIAAALLALAIDQLLALIERGLGTRRRGWVVAGSLGIALIVIGALAPGWSRPHARYVVGAKTFAEQYILAALIEQKLGAAGLSATRREGLGSSVILDALAGNEIDVYVDYTGTIWANDLHHNDARPRADVTAEVARWLKAQRGITLLGNLGFENAYALAMSKKRAQALGVRSIADLARVAPQLTIAGDYEFFSRPEWAAIQKAYGLSFRAQRTMQPEFMYPAAASGDVDVISAYTSEGRIAQYDLVVLEDNKHVIPPYDAVILIAPRNAEDHAFTEALRPLIGAIDVELMRAANLRATAGGNNGSPEAVARWMADEIARRTTEKQ